MEYNLSIQIDMAKLEYDETFVSTVHNMKTTTRIQWRTIQSVC